MESRRPIRVAQVTTTAVSVRYLLRDHIERLLTEGYEVDVVCGPDDSTSFLEGLGIRVVQIPFVREPSPVADLKTTRALWSLFKSKRYDIVHSHTPKAGLLSPVAGRLARTPVVLHTVHGLLFHDKSRPMEKALGAVCEFWTAGFAHRLLSQSREDIQVAARVHLKAAERIDYIGNGIDIQRFNPGVAVGARDRLRAELGAGHDDVVVGMVGRMVREKGFLEFFEAMRQVMDVRPNVRMLLIGPTEKDQSDGLDPVALTSNLDPARTAWLGHRSDIPELYGAMDVFALPSYREGVPRALMEASASGLPVVATNIRGCREVVKDGETGILIEPRQVPPLRNAILRLVDDSALRTRMGQAGRAHIVKEFDAELVLDRLAAYYRNLVNTHRLGENQ